MSQAIWDVGESEIVIEHEVDVVFSRIDAEVL